jgi:hypothetical protein
VKLHDVLYLHRNSMTYCNFTETPWRLVSSQKLHDVLHLHRNSMTSCIFTQTP